MAKAICTRVERGERIRSPNEQPVRAAEAGEDREASAPA